MGKGKDEGSHLVGGVILIVLGLIFFGDELNLTPDWNVGRLWPLILITIGVVRFVVPHRDGSRGGGAWLVFVGAIFMLHNYNLMSLHRSWPLFVVAAGVSILFSARAAARRRLDEPMGDHHDR